MSNEESMTREQMRESTLSMFSCLEKTIEMATQASKCKGISKHDREFMASELKRLIDFRDSIAKDVESVRADEKFRNESTIYALNRLFSNKTAMFRLINRSIVSMQDKSSTDYFNHLEDKAKKAKSSMNWYKSKDRKWYKKAGYQLSALMGGRYKQVFKDINRQIKDSENAEAHESELVELRGKLDGTFKTLIELSRQMNIDGPDFGILEHSSPSAADTDVETPSSARDSLLSIDGYSMAEEASIGNDPEGKRAITRSLLSQDLEGTDSGIEEGPSTRPTPEGTENTQGKGLKI